MITAVILAGYLLGSIAFAYNITRLDIGRDIRYKGKGTVDGRDVGHVVGDWAGVLTTRLDAAKAAAACLLALTHSLWRLTLDLAG